jgi:hypothetical protein
MMAITTSSSISVNAALLPGPATLFRFKKNGPLFIAFMHFISFFVFGTNISASFASTTEAYDEKAMDADFAGRRARRLFALPE